MIPLRGTRQTQSRKLTFLASLSRLTLVQPFNGADIYSKTPGPLYCSRSSPLVSQARWATGVASDAAVLPPKISSKQVKQTKKANRVEEEEDILPGALGEHIVRDEQTIPRRNISPEQKEYLSKYQKQYKDSLQNMDRYWMDKANAISWHTKPSKARGDHPTMKLPSGEPYTVWYPEGKLNLSHLCLDVHVEEGRGDLPALLYENCYVPSTSKVTTYSELLHQVKQFAAGLLQLGIKKGDRVLLYMPMITETAVAMLACARIGAIHVVVFGGFSSQELAKRIEAADCRAIVMGSCGLEPGKVIDYKVLMDSALEIVSSSASSSSSSSSSPSPSSVIIPSKVVLIQRDMHRIPPGRLVEGRDILFEDFIANGKKNKELYNRAPEWVDSHHPSYVLYTSGTTGTPKGVVRDTAGSAVSLRHTMENVYGMKPGDSFWAASDMGWAAGHSLIVYGPLIYGCASVILEGKPVGTPDPSTFWRIMATHNVRGVFLAPTALRAIKREDPELELLEQYKDRIHPSTDPKTGKSKGLRALFVAGERADFDTIQWASKGLNTPVIDHWWQTETGFPVSGPVSPLAEWTFTHGSAGLPQYGFDVRILSDDGVELPALKSGNIVIKLPLPPGCLTGLWKADDRFVKSYLSRFQGYYDTADAGFLDEHGYLYVMARTDDVMNVAGHRLATSPIEEALAKHPSVAECCVVGVPDTLKGEVPVGFVVLKHTHEVGTSHSIAYDELAEVAAKALALAEQEKKSQKSKSTTSKPPAAAGAKNLALQAEITERERKLEKELIHMVRENVGAVATPKRVLIVRRLPKTRSGKILRATIRNIVKFAKDKSDGKFPQFSQAVPIPSTIEDASVLDSIRVELERAELF